MTWTGRRIIVSLNVYCGKVLVNEASIFFKHLSVASGGAEIKTKKENNLVRKKNITWMDNVRSFLMPRAKWLVGGKY